MMPQKLQLDPASQCVLVENMEVLRANGFDFVVKNDKGKNVTKRWQVVGCTISRLTIFL